jgi:hypothetical protein
MFIVANVYLKLLLWSLVLLGNTVLVAVKKQKSILYNRVTFPIGELVEVAPPPAEVQKLGLDADHVGIPVFDTRFQVRY